ncbi:uncharacterized protein METZ01_LOCUS355127 [marine metagenome]|uniref:Uncharacterized protein n=1 Tax=marine metagenome TaxID=408172 RepID=A0A382RXB6_9ZZZZ
MNIYIYFSLYIPMIHQYPHLYETKVHDHIWNFSLYFQYKVLNSLNC